jgi:hypothetical protein
MPQEVNTDGLGLVHAGLESKKKQDEASAPEDKAEHSLDNRATSPSQRTQFEQVDLRSESPIENDETSSRTSDDPDVTVLREMQQRWEDIMRGLTIARRTIEVADRYRRRNSSKCKRGRQKFSQTELDYHNESSAAAMITRRKLEAEKRDLLPKLQAQRKKLLSIPSVSYAQDPPAWRTTPSQFTEQIGWKGVMSDSDDDEEEEEEDEDEEEEEESEEHDANLEETIQQIEDATIECFDKTFENNNDDQEGDDQLIDETQNELDLLIQSELESVLAEEKDDAHSAIAPQQNPHELPITQSPSLLGKERIDRVTSAVR